jgi:hypothetical protein
MSVIAASTSDRLVARAPAALPFVVAGAVFVIAGGITAAVARPTGFELGSWVAAYLVLVGGVAQIALGLGQAWLARDAPTRRSVRAEVITWNAAVALTLAGTLVATPLLTTLGGLALVAALVLFLGGVRHAGSSSAPSSTPSSTLARRLYRGVGVVVLVSTPIGLALAWIRHG